MNLQPSLQSSANDDDLLAYLTPLIIKQKKAKSSLFEVSDTIELKNSIKITSKKLIRKENNFIGWSQKEPQNPHLKEIKNNIEGDHSLHIQSNFRKPKSLITRIKQQPQNMIPQLKNQLEKLESPQKKIKHTEKKCNLQLYHRLNQRRKNTIKVSDIFKLKQNSYTINHIDKPQNKNGSFSTITNNHTTYINQLNNYSIANCAYMIRDINPQVSYRRYKQNVNDISCVPEKRRQSIQKNSRIIRAHRETNMKTQQKFKLTHLLHN